MENRFPASSPNVGHNPIQEQANRNRKVRFRGADGKLKVHPAKEVPPGLQPHPFVDPKLEPQQPLPEDRPAGSPPTP